MIVVALLAVLALLFAGPAAGQGSVTLYTSESQDKVNEMKADFEKRQPGVGLNIYRSGTQVVIGKLQAEMQAGAIQADLVWMADVDFFAQLARKNLLQAYTVPGAEGVPAKFHYEGGRYHEVRLIFNTVGYNTLRVKERPTSWKDLADPRYKGKVGMASPFYSGAAFSTLGTLVPQPAFGWPFFQRLKDNGVVVEQSNGTVAQKLATGEFRLASVVDFFLRDMKAKGSPVDHVWPREGAILIPTPIGILQGAKNTAGAQAFLRYLYSPEGQRLFAQQGYVPVRSGVEGPAGLPAEKLEILPTDEAYIATHREELKGRYRELFESPGGFAEPTPPKVLTQELSPSDVFRRAAPSVYVLLAAKSLDDLRLGRLVSQGSAVAVSSNTALTNCHVVEGNSLLFLLHDKEQGRARVEKSDTKADLCVIQSVDFALTPVAAVRPYGELKVGDRVYSIGAPRGLAKTLAEGLISGLRRDGDRRLIQMTAPISPGSSGGGLFDGRGNLVGITTYLLKESQSLNFAVAVDEYSKK